ncbi:MAG TPA: hypothetical protein DCZ69_18220, partial [Syntrophobacteraceae bacterium]|nr:hypothetical protein [Syntrophobacteraceae bacterium]
PDLVCTFGQRQESIGGVLQAFGFQGAVLHQDAGTIAEAISNIQDVGIATDVEDIAKPLCTHLKKRIQKVRRQVAAIQYDKRPRVLRIMHWEPLISVGPGSFQHDVIEKAGGVNLTGDGTQPYSCCKPEVIIQRDPEVIFFCGSEILARLREDPQ